MDKLYKNAQMYKKTDRTSLEYIFFGETTEMNAFKPTKNSQIKTYIFRIPYILTRALV